jgi:hypothetical protein
MKKGVLIGLMMATFATTGAWAETAQQDRMKSCNEEAGKKSLSGDARKDFMKSCLSGATTDAKPAAAKPAEKAKPAAVAPVSNKDAKALTPQQKRMQDCNAEATAKDMKGDPRKTFMKSCLSNKK